MTPEQLITLRNLLNDFESLFATSLTESELKAVRDVVKLIERL